MVREKLCKDLEAELKAEQERRVEESRRYETAIADLQQQSHLQLQHIQQLTLNNAKSNVNNNQLNRESFDGSQAYQRQMDGMLQSLRDLSVAYTDLLHILLQQHTTPEEVQDHAQTLQSLLKSSYHSAMEQSVCEEERQQLTEHYHDLQTTLQHRLSHISTVDVEDLNWFVPGDQKRPEVVPRSVGDNVQPHHTNSSSIGAAQPMPTHLSSYNQQTQYLYKPPVHEEQEPEDVYEHFRFPLDPTSSNSRNINHHGHSRPRSANRTYASSNSANNTPRMVTPIIVRSGRVPQPSDFFPEIPTTANTSTDVREKKNTIYSSANASPSFKVKPNTVVLPVSPHTYEDAQAYHGSSHPSQHPLLLDSTSIQHALYGGNNSANNSTNTYIRPHSAQSHRTTRTGTNGSSSGATSSNNSTSSTNRSRQSAKPGRRVVGYDFDVRDSLRNVIHMST
jgi:hypothetical protein